MEFDPALSYVGGGEDMDILARSGRCKFAGNRVFFVLPWSRRYG
jgi:hypothetical protein